MFLSDMFPNIKSLNVPMDPDEEPKKANPMVRALRWVWDLTRLPSPVELGRSKYNALPMRGFGCDDPDAYTWDEWHAEVKSLHPVKYFIREVVIDWFETKWRRLTDRYYDVKGFWWSRYHILDLRKYDPQYKGGYRDPCYVLLQASFHVLEIYVREEGGLRDPAEWASAEELAEEPLKSQKAVYEEAKALHEWWTKGRFEEEAEEDRLFKLYQEAKVNKGSDDDAWFKYREYRETERPVEMLTRLAKIQPYLWT